MSTNISSSNSESGTNTNGIVTYTVNGEVLYSGAIEKMPPEVKIKYDKFHKNMNKSMKKMNESMDKSFRKFDNEMKDFNDQMRNMFKN